MIGDVAYAGGAVRVSNASLACEVVTEDRVNAVLVELKRLLGVEICEHVYFAAISIELISDVHEERAHTRHIGAGAL